MDGTHTSEAFELHIKVQWRRAGRIKLNRDGSLKFPPVMQEEASMPGVYRIVWKKRDGQKNIYIGESENPWRRTTAYRKRPTNSSTPAGGVVVPRVPPNRALSIQLRQAIRGGGFAEYQIAHVLKLELSDVDVDLRLDTVQRKLIENAGLMDVQRSRARPFNADAQPSARPGGTGNT